MPDRIGVVDLLRGLAAVAVCWFHFTQGNPAFLPDGAMKWSGRYGHLGVEVFFVISGFVLPYSLARGRYAFRDYPIFVAKRVLRLDPPFLASIAVVLALGWLSTKAPGFAGQPQDVSPAQVALHLGYLNELCGYSWLSPVYWTLAIEFQFYLLIALLFPVLAHRRAAVRLGVSAALCAAAFAGPGRPWVFQYLPLFTLGTLTFQYRVGAFRPY